MVNVDDPWGQVADQQERCWRCSHEPEAIGGVELTMTDLTMTSAGVSGEIVTPAGRGALISAGRAFNLMNLPRHRVLVQQGMPLAWC